ncbi:MAG: AAA family ATPase, partial [Bacteroidales bacterium]|nr:AAA family ATPase [Bacteroidales bacterium]
MEQLKNLPIGIQDFESLILDNYLYVDKTAIMYQLVSTGRYYFLSRPRRFGK